MIQTLLFLSLFLPACISCNERRPTAVEKAPAVSQHSSAFNASVQQAMQEYYALTEAFVNWDSSRVIEGVAALRTGLDSIKLDELKPGLRQSAIRSMEEAKKQLDTMRRNNALMEKRHSLNALTQNLFDALQAARYDEKKIFLQKCPMAFNDEDPGVWLSPEDSIRNPYLGLHHPRYGKAMIECGENISVIGKQ